MSDPVPAGIPALQTVKGDYVLVLKLRFQAADDADARAWVGLLRFVDEARHLANAEAKLQRVFGNKPPQPVALPE